MSSATPIVKQQPPQNGELGSPVFEEEPGMLASAQKALLSMNLNTSRSLEGRVTPEGKKKSPEGHQKPLFQQHQPQQKQEGFLANPSSTSSAPSAPIDYSPMIRRAYHSGDMRQFREAINRVPLQDPSSQQGIAFCLDQWYTHTQKYLMEKGCVRPLLIKSFDFQIFQHIFQVSFSSLSPHHRLLAIKMYLSSRFQRPKLANSALLDRLKYAGNKNAVRLFKSEIDPEIKREAFPLFLESGLVKEIADSLTDEEAGEAFVRYLRCDSVSDVVQTPSENPLLREEDSGITPALEALLPVPSQRDLQKSLHGPVVTLEFEEKSPEGQQQQPLEASSSTSSAPSAPIDYALGIQRSFCSKNLSLFNQTVNSVPLEDPSSQKGIAFCLDQWYTSMTKRLERDKNTYGVVQDFEFRAFLKLLALTPSSLSPHHRLLASKISVATTDKLSYDGKCVFDPHLTAVTLFKSENNPEIRREMFLLFLESGRVTALAGSLTDEEVVKTFFHYSGKLGYNLGQIYSRLSPFISHPSQEKISKTMILELFRPVKDQSIWRRVLSGLSKSASSPPPPFYPERLYEALLFLIANHWAISSEDVGFLLSQLVLFQENKQEVEYQDFKRGKGYSDPERLRELLLKLNGGQYCCSSSNKAALQKTLTNFQGKKCVRYAGSDLSTFTHDECQALQNLIALLPEPAVSEHSNPEFSEEEEEGKVCDEEASSPGLQPSVSGVSSAVGPYVPAGQNPPLSQTGLKHDYPLGSI